MFVNLPSISAVFMQTISVKVARIYKSRHKATK